MRILIVEDNPGDVILLGEAFKENGNGEFELTHASDFESAMRMIFKEKVDAILLDLSTPLFFGLEPLARIHKARPRIPVFILSGYNDPQLAAEAVRMGAQDYVVKNRLDGPVLIQKVRAAIEHRKQFLRKEPVLKRPG
jgi:DNA-binding NtrC family response regulator